MSFKENVNKYRDGSFYSNMVAPVAKFCSDLVYRIIGSFTEPRG